MPSNFTTTIVESHKPDIKLIELHGELDELGIEILKSTVDPVLNELTAKKVIFDFTHVIFINSKGIGYLVSVHTHLSKNARTLVIVNASQPVMDVISLVGLTSIIPYYANAEEALMNL